MKLIDAIVPPQIWSTAAKEWVKANPKAKAPWDVDGFKLPGGPVYSKAGMMIFPAANAIYRRETYDNYPAARAILQVVYEGLQLPMDLALQGRVALVRQNPALAGSGRDDAHAVRLDAGRSTRARAVRLMSRRRKLDTIGIIGAGFMGASIGYVAANAGMTVVLIDRDQATADKGKALAQKLVADQVNKGRVGAGRARRAARAHQHDRRLRRARALRSRHRGGVRGSQGQGRHHRQGAGGDRQGRDPRLQHLDAADHLARHGVPRARAASSASISSRRWRR